MFATFIRNQPNPKPNRDTNNNSQFLYSLRIYVFHCFIVTTKAERKDGIPTYTVIIMQTKTHWRFFNLI